MMKIQIRTTVPEDLNALYLIQLDEEANWNAAFVNPDCKDFDFYFQKYNAHLLNPEILNLTAIHDGEIVGSAAKFVLFGDIEITYWIDRKHWGKGIASILVRELLDRVQERPIAARIVADNIGSARVLEKNGFVKVGEEQGFSKVRNSAVIEWIYTI